MPIYELQTFEHVLELGPGETGAIPFRFPKDRRQSFDVRRSGGRPGDFVELALEDYSRGYDMGLVKGGDERWTPLFPADDGDVHVTLDLAAGERFSIEIGRA